MKYKFSVFTPTYNRAKDIVACYFSLCKQTFSDFEWIVIDDGSNDNTNQVMEEIMKSARFPIVYRYQENKDKHVAQNRALDLAQGELFLPLDSDDQIVENAMEVMWKNWERIKDKELYSGVGVHCMDKTGKRIGPAWPENGIVSNDLEMRFKYKITGEKWGCIRTDVMRKFPNAEVKGHFLSEGTVWYRIARRYKKVYIDECLRIYEVHEDSVSTRITREKDYNFESFLFSTCIYINEFSDYFLKYEFKKAIKNPLVLTKKCIENDYPVLIGKDALIKIVNPLYAKLLVACASAYKLGKIFM